MKAKWLMILGAISMGIVTPAKAASIYGWSSAMPAGFQLVARDLAEMANEVLARETRCSGRNPFGAYAEGGGCNRFGCWPAGGSCTAYGCSMSGMCTADGCDAKIESFTCEIELPRLGI